MAFGLLDEMPYRHSRVAGVASRSQIERALRNTRVNPIRAILVGGKSCGPDFLPDAIHIACPDRSEARASRRPDGGAIPEKILNEGVHVAEGVLARRL